MTLTLLYITGAHEELFTFYSLQEKEEWERELGTIKDESSRAFDMKTRMGLSHDVRNKYNEWIARVRAFKDRFGTDRVPLDIRSALNNAEQGLQDDVTTW